MFDKNQAVVSKRNVGTIVTEQSADANQTNKVVVLKSYFGKDFSRCFEYVVGNGTNLNVNV